MPMNAPSGFPMQDGNLASQSPFDVKETRADKVRALFEKVDRANA